MVREPPADADADRRLSLVHLNAFAIDDEATVEVDDALSVEALDDGRTRVWIHIADPTRFIEYGSLLEKEARRRQTSIYLPTETVPMLPLALAAGPLSLRPDHESCALSVGVVLAKDGKVNDTDVLITPTLIQSTRLTYEAADVALGGQGEGTPDRLSADQAADLRQLHAWAQRREEWRRRQGSTEAYSQTPMPDARVKAARDATAEDGWTVFLDGESGQGDKESSARTLVKELMLVAGESIARFGAAHDVPLLYRAQSMRDLDWLAVEDLPDGMAKTWFVIGHLEGLRLTPGPEKHQGLGLSAYVWATSPIRRYADLLLHFQIKAHLRGDPLPFQAPGDGAEQALVAMIQQGGDRARKLERGATEYWTKEFFRRSAQRGDSFTATVLMEKRDGSLLCAIRETGTLTACAPPGGETEPHLGQVVCVLPGPTGELTIARLD